MDISFLPPRILPRGNVHRKEGQDFAIKQECERGKFFRIEVIRISLDKEGEITLKSGKNEEIVEVSGSGSD